MRPISLLQPRHSYAPPEGVGHVYSPTSLWTAGARIMAAGGEVREFADENLRPFEPQTDVVGMNLLGAPYVPVVRQKIFDVLGDEILPVVGGRVIDGLMERGNSTLETADRSQLTKLFGDRVINGNNDFELASALGLHANNFPLVEETSLIPAYERISDADMRQYLSREISFYLSQGCSQRCRFCAAKRTKEYPRLSIVQQVREEYRTPEVLEADLHYLLRRAKSLGMTKLSMYLSNLDLFQTPSKLKEFASIVQRAKQDQPECTIGMRGLSTASWFVKVHRHHPDVIRAMVEAGLHTVGFGVDGSPEDWKRELKLHNTESNCIAAIRIAREVYGLTPEVLMVFGFQHTSEQALRAAYDFARDMQDRYGAVLRPHMAKDLVPGTDYWEEEQNRDRVAYLLEHPEAFQAFDFTTLPCELTHPDATIRHLSAEYYLKIASLARNITSVTYPVCSPELSEQERRENAARNIGRFDI